MHLESALGRCRSGVSCILFSTADTAGAAALLIWSPSRLVFVHEAQWTLSTLFERFRVVGTVLLLLHLDLQRTEGPILEELGTQT